MTTETPQWSELFASSFFSEVYIWEHFCPVCFNRMFKSSFCAKMILWGFQLTLCTEPPTPSFLSTQGSPVSAAGSCGEWIFVYLQPLEAQKTKSLEGKRSELCGKRASSRCLMQFQSSSRNLKRTKWPWNAPCFSAIPSPYHSLSDFLFLSWICCCDMSCDMP